MLSQLLWSPVLNSVGQQYRKDRRGVLFEKLHLAYALHSSCHCRQLFDSAYLKSRMPVLGSFSSSTFFKLFWPLETSSFIGAQAFVALKLALCRNRCPFLQVQHEQLVPGPRPPVTILPRCLSRIPQGWWVHHLCRARRPAKVGRE
jgi:hypothetical protein